MFDDGSNKNGNSNNDRDNDMSNNFDNHNDEYDNEDNGSVYDDNMRAASDDDREYGSGHHGYSGNEHYSSMRNEQPRWQPDPEKYNCNYSNTAPKQEKNSSKWVIPLVIILALMIVVIACGVVFGARYLRNMVQADSQVTSSETGKVYSDSEISEEVTVASSQTGNSKSGIVITDVTDIVSEVKPAVVSITSRTLINKYSNNDLYNYFFRQFYGDDDSQTQEEIESGIGSGTIIGKSSTELLILTSYHVVEGSSSLAVTFTNDVSVDGTIKSSSNDTDIAIVAVPLADIDSDTLASIKIAQLSTDPAEVGEGVVVIGNPLGYGISVTTGIVSAVDREIQVDNRTLTVMQTDAAINQGNSGGCVLNSRGELIGISEAKISESGVEGMSYAIPVANNSEVIDVLLENESNEEASEEETKSKATGAYLGIRGRDITSDLAEAYGLPEGVYVSSVLPGGGSEDAGLQEGDIIIAIDGSSTKTMEMLQQQLSDHNVGDTVTVMYERADNGDYEQYTVDVTLTGKIG